LNGLLATCKRSQSKKKTLGKIARNVKTSQIFGVWKCVNEVQICVLSVQCRFMVFGVINPGRCMMGNVVKVNPEVCG